METGRADVAVLVTCHGTVERLEDIPAFVRNIRHGRPAPEEVIAEVGRRFTAIGGSPLMRITEAQARALEARLSVPVRAAARLWDPSPEAVCGELVAAGATRIVSLPLAPQSVHVYHEAVSKALGDRAEMVRAPSWGLEPRLTAAFGAAIAEAQAALPEALRAAVVLTAHSLPMRIIEAGDPYQRDFEAMAEAVGERLVEAGWDRAAVRIAYQSQGMGGAKGSPQWLGPDLPTTFADLARSGHRALLVAPIGFLAEHVETLYDIDVEARATAESLGFAALVRMPPMNTRPDFIDALEAVARPLL